LFFQKGNDEFKKGNHAKAIEYYTYATELDPKNHIFFSNRATAYFSMQDYAKSLRDSEKAVALDNTWWKGHSKGVECLMKLNRFQEAADKATACARQFSKEEGERTTQFAKFAADAKAALRGSMSPAEWNKTLGNEAFKAGKIDEAIKLYGEALRTVDTKTDEGKSLASAIYANRAACNRQLYMHDEVVADCTRSIELEPENVKAFIRRAQSYESMEKYSKALSDFEFASANGGGKVAMDGAARVRKGMANFEKNN